MVGWKRGLAVFQLAAVSRRVPTFFFQPRNVFITVKGKDLSKHFSALEEQQRNQQQPQQLQTAGNQPLSPDNSWLDSSRAGASTSRLNVDAPAFAPKADDVDQNQEPIVGKGGISIGKGGISVGKLVIGLGKEGVDADVETAKAVAPTVVAAPTEAPTIVSPTPLYEALTIATPDPSSASTSIEVVVSPADPPADDCASVGSSTKPAARPAVKRFPEAEDFSGAIYIVGFLAARII